jgi:pimeloyl-ACP methyl ester carboxylesterase
MQRTLAAAQDMVVARVEGPEVEAYKAAQEKLLRRYAIAAESRYANVKKPALKAHVLVAGQGEPVLMLHGGGMFASQFAPLIGSLQDEFRLFAVDRPGCGLSDKVDYSKVSLSLRQHAVDFVGSALDALELREATIVGSSMGGLWALWFALAEPKRGNKLVLVGEPAWSGPEVHPPPPAQKAPTLETVRDTYAARQVADIKRVPQELLEATVAARRLPGSDVSWNTLLQKFIAEKSGTYHLRPELKNLQLPTLFIWGEKDTFGPPSLGKEMAAMARNARCEVLADAGHHVWIDQPERCAKLTREFLR